MPCFRGIEICVIASREAKQIPEYPHPDGSSVRLVYPSPTSHASEDVDPTRHRKANPCVSVYIPSLPGEQFWLRYLVTQSPPPSPYLFFKLAINRRPITSWGLDVDVSCTGSVVRALYEPEHDIPGIETRYFHFAIDQPDNCVAEDGGLIEVHVFRCKGRKRIAPQLPLYRGQDRYGVASPSGGMVNNPEDATYYNYYLIDAKDSPYATFCFHYRTMTHLRQLNLVNQRQTSTSPMPLSPVADAGIQMSSPLADPFEFDDLRMDASPWGDHENDDGYPDEDGAVERPGIPRDDFLSGGSPSSVNSMDETSLTEQTSRNLCRLLPDIPISPLRPTSASSMRSNCPSLTPSLRNYVESDNFEEEEIRVSTAQPLIIPSESMQALELGAGNDDGGSFSDYASSPRTAETFHSPLHPSLGKYIPTTGSVLERQLRQFDSPAPASPLSFPQKQVTPAKAHVLLNREKMFGFGEAEQSRQIPSPSICRPSRTEGSCSVGVPGKRHSYSVGMKAEEQDDGGSNVGGGAKTGPPGNWI